MLIVQLKRFCYTSDEYLQRITNYNELFGKVFKVQVQIASMKLFLFLFDLNTCQNNFKFSTHSKHAIQQIISRQIFA